MSTENQENFPEVDPADLENYKAPPQKTIEEILSLDNEDESLRKYKEALLGSQAETIIVEANNPKNVLVKKLALVVADREDVILDLESDLSKLKKQTFTIKEGIQYKIRIDFFTQREIVHGLKYVQKTYRLGVPGKSNFNHLILSFLNVDYFSRQNVANDWKLPTKIGNSKLHHTFRRSTIRNVGSW